ncbi:MAG: hypothetical protein IKE60_17980 [Reyranella sp.]|jgi:hypothetical protein|uniref:hypothetical protein n=1 Tax=Reyranella sp. TaxID=1929291 RepID=UPI000962EED3|nr:hypothetical protein [Reyranella sp.]MBN9542074.1 hypothetical protein [Alphaproteobacteria bacterium]MBR2816548.1 hypothetical protein [Reyranella sp.]OJU36980.1 MAG: hypothetical protein BGN99_29200 [Alphaproteobacteria bacterium 65-37]
MAREHHSGSAKLTAHLQAGALAGLSLLLPLLAEPVRAETWIADMKLERQRSAGLCLKGVESAYTMELTGSTLVGKARNNPFRARVAADGTVRDDFLAELDPGLNQSVSTKLQKFTITGNARTRDLELAWPASACIWKLAPRGA